MFQPRTADQIRAEMMAQLIAQTELTDLEEGGVAHSLMGVQALQLALHEQRLAGLYRAFSLQGQGADLDEQIAQMPGVEPRKGPTAASGPAMRFERLQAEAPLEVPAGLRVSSRLNPGVEYLTTEAFTMAAGQRVYPASGQAPVRVVCLAWGVAGNAQAGTLTVLNYTPVPEVVACTNVANVSGGLAREEDAALRWRGLHYLASLAQTSKPAVEYLARLFQSSDGTRARHAFIVEDARTPAYAELVVDDGAGFQGTTRPGADITFTTAPGGQRSFHFESPAATTPKVQIGTTLAPSPSPDWVVLHERGVAQLHPDSAALSTAEQPVRVFGYEVYEGFIAELQAAIEGLVTLPSRAPGWRVPGARLRVVAPELQPLTFEALLVVEEGHEFNTIRARLTEAIEAFLHALPPGQPLILFQLLAELRRLPGVYNVRLTSPAGDVYPATPRTKLVALAGGTRISA